MTDSGSIDLGKKVEKICKNAENYFHQVYSERIYDEEHLAQTITKLNWRHPTAFALCKQKCLGLQKMTLSGITSRHLQPLSEPRSIQRKQSSYHWAVQLKGISQSNLLCLLVM